MQRRTSCHTIHTGGQTHLVFFFFNDTATTEIYTLSLHDALPISSRMAVAESTCCLPTRQVWAAFRSRSSTTRSEEHTSELQSQSNLVCRLLLEKKKKFIVDAVHVILQYSARTLVLSSMRSFAPPR